MKQLLTAFFTLVLSTTFAQWELGDRTPKGLGLGNKVEINPVFTNDEQGNTYIAWTDFRNGNGELYVQKINKQGKSIWEENGIRVGAVIAGENYAFTPMSIIAHNGGVSLTWQRMPSSNNRNSKELVTQTVNSNGTLSKPSGEELIAQSIYNEVVVNAIITQGFDDSNEPFLVYNVLNSASNIDRVFFRKNGQEKLLFSTSGDGSKVLVDKTNKRLIAIIANGSDQVTAISFDYNGTRLSSGKSVYSNPFSGKSRIDYITVDKGNTYIARTLSSDFQKRVIAQKLDADFNRLWGDIGIELGSNTGFDMQLSANPDGGATLAWIEPNSNTERMKAARVSFDGKILWEKSVFKGNENVNYFSPNKYATDGRGGCYILWFTPKGVGFDLHVQHMDPNGIQLWGDKGIAIQDFNWYSNFRLVNHIDGGVIALYSGTKDTDVNADNSYDLYTNYLAYDGVFGLLQGDEPKLAKTTFCPTETFSAELPEGTYKGVLQYDRGLFNLVKTEGENKFTIPANITGAYRLIFTNEKQESTLPVNITIITPSSPTKIAGNVFKCLSDTTSIELSSSCMVGNVKWDTDAISQKILVKPTQTTTYNASCVLPSCPLEPNVSHTVEVGVVNATATAPSQNFAGSDIQLMANGGVSYVWKGPSGFSSFLQNPVIPNAIVTDAGEYEVMVADVKGCAGVAKVMVNIAELLSIFDTENLVNIFPNPTNEYLMVNENIAILNSEVINAVGMSMPVHNKDNKIELGNLMPGAYVLRLETTDRRIVYKRFIKK